MSRTTRIRTALRTAVLGTAVAATLSVSLAAGASASGASGASASVASGASASVESGHPAPGSAGSGRLAARTLQRVSPHVLDRHRRRAATAQQSLNWSGYIRAGHGFTAATGSWTVPTLSSSHEGYSSTWVGIDGATSGDGYLIQTGTEADVADGRRSYRAWWEVITPSDEAPETLFSTLTIHPGDAISASVSKASSGRWTLRLTDSTTHRSASHTTSFAGPGSSAEWIQEDTDVNGSISTAPDWGSVSFRRLTLDGANPKLLASEGVDIVDRTGVRETSTGAPTSSGAGFTVTWLAAGTTTSAS